MLVWLLWVLLRLAGLTLLVLKVGGELLRVAHDGGVERGAHRLLAGIRLRLNLGGLVHIGIVFG